MSKAFLFIALALIVAMATAKFYNVAINEVPTACEDIVYQAASRYFVSGDYANEAAFETAQGDCYVALNEADFTENTIAADAPCFAATAPGAATGCGIANDAACVAADFCVSNNQCVAAKCKLDPRYVWKFAAVTAKADVAAAIQTILNTLEVDVPPAPLKTLQDETYFPCKTDATQETTAPTITVVDQTPEGNGKWWLVGFGDTLTAECSGAFSKITPVTLMPMNVQKNTCSTCVAWVNRFMDTNYFTCPCADAATIISQSKHKLVENVKLSQVKDFFKTGDCLVSVNVVVGENGEFVLQTETKTTEVCTTVDPEEAKKQADELKKLVTPVTTDTKIGQVTALAADCVVGGKWSCATVEKCATLRCGKNAKCSVAADAAPVCAGKCVLVDETKPEGEAKCNSASVVGYVVALVAVIAAFVF